MEIVTAQVSSSYDIFNDEKLALYNIPNYQRPYSWEEANINDFLNDIYSENDGYYIGNILFIKKSNVEYSHNITYEVVDGQQRITSLALIYLAISYSFFSFLPNASHSVSRNIYTKQDRIKCKLATTDHSNTVIKHKLNLLKKDNEVYSTIFSFIYSDNTFDENTNIIEYISNNISCDKRRLMWKRFIDILEWINENCYTYDDLVVLYDKLNYLKFVIITCNDLGDAFTIFSSINAKGLPLTLIDLIKVKYLSTVGNLESNLIKEYEDKWTELLDIFGESEKDSNHNKVIQFLQNYYDTFIGTTATSITKKGALKGYEKVFVRKGADFIDELIKHARIFVDIINSEYIVNKQVQPNVVNDPYVLRVLSELYRMESSSIYPFLMFLLDMYHRDLFPQSNLLNILYTIKAFYVKRNITLKPKASNIRSRVLETIRILQNSCDINLIVSTISKLLNEISVSDEQFKLDLCEPIYSKSNSKTLRIILIDLSRKYNDGYFSKSREDTLDYYISEYKGRSLYRWTIEHILPYGKLNADWIQSIGNGDKILAEDLQDKYKNKLGNLTLTPYNSEMSNNSFINKRDYYNENKSEYEGLRTGLFLNESIADQDEDISTKDMWTVDDIDRRTEILANLIVDLYKINSIDIE